MQPEKIYRKVVLSLDLTTVSVSMPPNIGHNP